MKKTPSPPATPPGTLEEARNENPLRIRRRSVANLTENQMEDAAGGHPHHTCDPTCPATCCPTCPKTCGDTCGTCPEPTDVDCPTIDCPTRDNEFTCDMDIC